MQVRKFFCKFDSYCTVLLCEYLLSERAATGSVAWKEVCQISDDCFTVPGGYRKLNQLGGRGMIDEEEELLQLAIRQSLLEQSGGRGNVSTGQLELSIFPGPVPSFSMLHTEKVGQPGDKATHRYFETSTRNPRA